MRYSFVAQLGPSSGDSPGQPLPDTHSWVEHDPSGIKRYYGRGIRSPAPGEDRERARRDAPGSSFAKGARTATRSPKNSTTSPTKTARTIRAQKLPIVSRIAWGGNRTTNAPAQFELKTAVEWTNGADRHAPRAHRAGQAGDFNLGGRRRRAEPVFDLRLNTKRALRPRGTS